MSNFRRIIVAVFAAAFSLGAAGCASGGKADSTDHQKADQPKEKKTEQPKGDHPKH